MDATSKFFTELGRLEHVPLLEKADGSVRFDISDGDRIDHVLVTSRKGDVAVSDSDADADCVVEADRALFERIANGETNIMAAALRGAVRVKGDVGVAMLVQRAFPGPPRSPNQ
jgi:putative sterol carrier protein